MIRYVCLYSPAIILFVWAVFIISGIEGNALTALGRVLLGIALAVHIRQELHDRKS